MEFSLHKIQSKDSPPHTHTLMDLEFHNSNKLGLFSADILCISFLNSLYSYRFQKLKCVKKSSQKKISLHSCPLSTSFRLIDVTMVIHFLSIFPEVVMHMQLNINAGSFPSSLFNPISSWLFMFFCSFFFFLNSYILWRDFHYKFLKKTYSF